MSIHFHLRWAAAGLLAFFAAAPDQQALAQTPTAPNYDGPCEVHVWPPEGIGATVDRLNLRLTEKGREVASGTTGAALPTARMFEIIRASDWPALTGLRSVTAFQEADTDATLRAWSSHVRATPSQAPCYFEIRVDLASFDDSLVWGRKLRMRVMIANYSTGLKKPKRVYDYDANPVPYDVLSTDPETLRVPLEAAFRANFEHVVRLKFAGTK